MPPLQRVTRAAVRNDALVDEPSFDAVLPVIVELLLEQERVWRALEVLNLCASDS
jgi:hypothetical protein